MNLSIQEILTQAFAFAILVFVLKKFAWKPLLQLLDERREKIRSGLEDIEQSKKDVEVLKQKYEELRAKIEEEARDRIQQAVSEGKRVGRELQDEARQEARKILDKAKDDLALEVAKAKVALREQIANLTLATTERLIREKMDAKKDKDLILQLIEDLEKLK